MRILVVTGASGGHIFPTLGFLDTLKNKDKDIDILLILPRKSITIPTENLGYRVKHISVSSIKLTLDFNNFIAILRFFKGAVESMAILLAFKPDIVVGFGSLVCIPMVSFARLLRIKTLIHEQNVIPGLANRFLAKFADKIAISFSESGDYFKDCKKKTVLTGNPMRRELNRLDKNKALDFFGFKSDKFTILVMGGSQGSRRINFEFLKAISLVADKFKFQIIHLAGARDYDYLKESYKDLNINFRLFSFLESMQYAYSACDLAISRAGATTIAEIMFFRLPAIIIPYPFAYQHQMANAKVLQNFGAGVIIPESRLESGILKKNIEDFANNSDRIKAIHSNYDNIHRLDANELLAKEAQSFQLNA